MRQAIKALLKQGPKVQLTAAALRRLEDPTWRKANGKWRWIVWLSMGLYAGPVLIVQGTRAKSRRLAISGYLATATFILAVALAPTEDTQPTTDTASSLFALLLIIPIVIGLWATTSFGKDVWVWKAMRDQVTGDWFSQNFGESVQPPAAELIQPKMSPITAEAIQDAGLVTQTKKSNFTGTIEINKASQESLEETGLFTAEQVRKILDRRDNRPIRNQDELRLLLELRPHELVSVAKHILFHTDAEGSAGSGRVLDL